MKHCNNIFFQSQENSFSYILLDKKVSNGTLLIVLFFIKRRLILLDISTQNETVIHTCLVIWEL